MKNMLKSQGTNENHGCIAKISWYLTKGPTKHAVQPTKYSGGEIRGPSKALGTYHS